MSFELHTYNQISKKRKHFKILQRKKTIRNIDRCALMVGIIFPLTSLPQIFEILSRKDAGGVSAITWTMWMVLDLFWLAYGMVHKAKPIIVSNILWIMLESTVVILTFIY